MKKLAHGLMAALVFQATFAHANCLNESNKVRMMAAGDIIFHGALLQQAMTDKKGFESLWKPVQGLLNQADLRYGNLEGPAAEKINDRGQFDPAAIDGYDPAGNIYSPGTEGKSYTFNFHPDSVSALKDAGFQVLSLANNHSADRRKLGIDRTIELLNDLGLAGYGTKHSNGTAQWTQTVEKNGIRFGFVGCTYGVNSGTNLDQVLLCYQKGEPNPTVLDLIRTMSQQVDLVVFTPHWGAEYSFEADSKQKKMTNAVIASGARLILGSHPHVLQPIEVRQEAGRVQAIVAYSLGNWVTNQQPYDYKDQAKHMKFFSQRISMMMFLEIEKTNQGIVLNLPMLVPTYMAAKHETGFGGRALYPAYPELYEGNRSLKRKIETAQRYVEVGNPFDVSSDLKVDHYKNIRAEYLKYKVSSSRLANLFCEGVQ